MITGVDGNEANVALRVGVSVYTLNLLKYFKKRSQKNLQFKIFLRQPPLTDLPSPDSYFTYEVVPGKLFWSQIFLPLRLHLKKDVNIFFSPAHYIPRFCPVPTVVTIHDLSFLYYTKDFLITDLIKLRKWTKYSIRKAKKIIAVSKTTKKDIMKFYHIPENKVEVIYNGYEKIPPARQKSLRLFKNYILYVGTLQPRKNLITLIQAFQLFKRLNREFKLVIVGKKGWLYKEIFQKVKNLGLKDQVVFTDYLDDQRLISLYQNAFCFVLPSFYEGFGIPILEAMSLNCPVISSSASSLPEVGGNACLYFDPYNINDLVEKMKLLKQDDKLRKELIKKGKQRIREFSWEQCGKKTLAIIKKVETEHGN